jgi:starch synthase (maltosyl-transferring)
VPVGEGSEEYLNSEKYEIKARDWDAPGNLVDFVTTINRIRRENRALHLYRNLAFYGADDPNILWYGKMTPDRDNTVFVAVNLDVNGPHASPVEMPLAELGLGPDEPYVMHELLSDRRYDWRGPRGHVVLDPAIDSAQIFAFHRA